MVLIRTQKTKSRLPSLREDYAYQARDNWNTYDASESLLMPPSDCGLPDTLIIRPGSDSGQQKLLRSSLVKTPNSCLHCTALNSTASYENLNYCKHEHFEAEEKRYATSLPSLHGTAFWRAEEQSRRYKHVHGKNSWGRLVNGVWDIDPQW
ncbi:unnamed protein product [Echinostoma caproni]|uniref:Uncharacterized protein n=1 Tax=Echinostoma caproni TaxID=27848 RepID=A0A183ADH5_9TREM|nr:unnamed protein product [Echinostoma caproni]